MTNNQPANNNATSPAAPRPTQDQPAESPKDPAADRLCESPLPLGEGVPFDPELYEPRLTPEELEELRDDENEDDE